MGGFVVDKVALGQVFLRVLPCQHNSTTAAYSHIISRRTIGPLVAAVQRDSLTPLKKKQQKTTTTTTTGREADFMQCLYVPE
jgi:hypothetical protein